MSKPWFCERVDEGWEIRDRTRTLVAVVPDEFHEQRANAKLILAAPHLGERHARLVELLRSRHNELEGALEASHRKVQALVGRVAREAASLRASMPGLLRGKPSVESLAMLVTKLADAQREAQVIYEQLATLRSALRTDAADV